MSNASNTDMDFTDQLESIILENLSNEQFGVSELAEIMNMSRSNLLRKIRKNTQLSASQFIRQVRLKKSMQLLRQSSLNISEISFQVGFGSTSYFIKCFREYYGYPPGEVGKGTVANEEEASIQPRFLKGHKRAFIAVAAFTAIILAFFVFINKTETDDAEIEKSIAVLPFKNESSDSSNLYFVNGLMESALNNLQKIEDLRVISRTSVEKYRHTDKRITEIAKELDVSYIVEGSGQRSGDRVLLNIQLVDASADKVVWVKQYDEKIVDIFDLQNEVATRIADAVKAKVTPTELDRIEEKPTENLLAYDYFLQGLGQYNTKTNEGLKAAILLFEKAVGQDQQFSLAYAYIAFSYYYIDLFQKQKQYTERINTNADKALLYNSKSAESLMAKALYYMQIKEYRLALPHLEKALEYNPNSSPVVQMLSGLYASDIPNTGKYLEYALKGIQLDIAANDSTGKSYIYLTLSNALIQNGFVEEAKTYTDKSLEYDPGNYYSPLLKTFILYAKNRNIGETQKLLIKEYNRDTTRLDILQEVAKFMYYREKYDSAFYYFEKFATTRERLGLDVYPQEDVKIAFVYKKKGLETQAAKFFNAYAGYCENDKSIYKSASTAVMYAYMGENDKAVEQLKIFATQDNYQYWILLFMELDPLLKPLKNNHEFKAVMQKIENRFWKRQENLKKLLENKGLI